MTTQENVNCGTACHTLKVWLDVVEFSHIARLEFVDDSDVGFECLEVAVPRPARYDLDMDVKLESRDNKSASGAMRG